MVVLFIDEFQLVMRTGGSGAKELRAEVYFEHNDCVLRSNHPVLLVGPAKHKQHEHQGGRLVSFCYY